MSFATSQPLVNKFLGTGDIATALRTHLTNTASNRSNARLKHVARAVVMTAAIRVHPVTLAKKMRRINALVQDLIN
jgi:hypothetical protein